MQPEHPVVGPGGRDGLADEQRLGGFQQRVHRAGCFLARYTSDTTDDGVADTGAKGAKGASVAVGPFKYFFFLFEY